ncbi:enoyl-[acyl-carrier-protein] reductase FabK [Tissierella creatinini]|nr:enoyl-[acyl-carrier-protein] reductase FabK [Tissierella creatinini]TJX66057.1 enoyl-[acyl-carrier-protein] reductase FabK [Soehngenia saccharolytica]
MINRVTQLLNIEYPIIQGGMAWVATYELAAAVSEAGGLGIIAAGNGSGEYLREQIKRIREKTDKPFGVNIMLMSPNAEDIVDIVCDERVPVVTTGAGNPGKYIERFKSLGIKVIPVVPTVSLAQRLEKLGADALIVEGTEAGGHIGELTTMAIIPQVVDAVKIPVIAAGGIGDSRGLVAAFALGAEGVQVGTRFVCSTEANVHENYKNEIIKAGDRDAVVTGRSTGHPVRVLKNKFVREYSNIEKTQGPEALEGMGTGRLKMAVVDGDVENGSVMAGQIAGLVCDIKSCKEIISEMFNGTSNVIEKISLLKGVEVNE